MNLSCTQVAPFPATSLDFLLRVAANTGKLSCKAIEHWSVQLRGQELLMWVVEDVVTCLFPAPGLRSQPNHLLPRAGSGSGELGL